MMLKNKKWVGLFVGVLGMLGAANAGVLSTVYFSDSVEVADSSDLNSDIAARTGGSLNLKYDTRAVSGAQNGNWKVAGGMLEFTGAGSDAAALYLVNAGNGVYQNIAAQLTGTVYQISFTVDVESGDAVDLLGVALGSSALAAPELQVGQIRARSQLDVLESGALVQRYDEWSEGQAYTVKLIVDETKATPTYEVFVDDVLKHAGTISFNTGNTRYVYIKLRDANGTMNARFDDLVIGQYIADPWSAADEVLFQDSVDVSNSTNLNAEIATRSGGALDLQYDTKTVAGAQNVNWEVVDGQLEFTGTSGAAANLYLVNRSTGGYQNFSSLAGSKYWIAASLNTLAADAVDSIGISLHDSIAGTEVLSVRQIRARSQIDVVPGGVTTRYDNWNEGERTYVVIEVNEIASPATYSVMVNGSSIQSGTLSFSSTSDRRIYFRIYDHNSDGNLNATIDDVSIVQLDMPDAFDVIPANNLVSNGQFVQVTNQTGSIPSNLIGSYGDFQAFENRTIEVTGWMPYHSDPFNLISMIGTEHLVTGDTGILNGTSYLDSLYNNNIVLNSSMSYRNGVVQSNILDGVLINPNVNYNFLVDVKKNTVTDNSQATFTAALTTGTDVTNTANVVSGSLMQVAQDALPAANGTFQAAVVSGADLLAAQSGGSVNVLFESVNAETIPDFPVVDSNDVANVELVSQVVIESVFLIVQNPAGDVNKDGFVSEADVELAQYYLDGAGGEPATNRQDQLISAGYTPAEAIAYLNLTSFDLDGDGYFDAFDVAAIEALLPPFLISIDAIGADLVFEWPSRADKLYDLESTESLAFTNWVPYDDGVTIHENIPASGVGVNTLPGVKTTGPARFFRVIEKN